MKYGIYLSTFVIISSFLFPKQILAHPLDEIGNVKIYDQKQTLEVGLNETTLSIDLTFYATEKIKVWESIDRNRDQKLDTSEKDEWMKKGQEASNIKRDGEQLNFIATKLDFPEYEDFFSQKPSHVVIQFLLDGTLKSNSNATYTYTGKDKKLDEITFEVKGVEPYSVENITKGDSDSVSFEIHEGDGKGGTVLGVNSGSRINQFLNTYVKPESIPFHILIFAFVVAFVLGGIHAMTPGHGKALVAGYLVGEKGTVRHAVYLGGIITVTHTASVFILGILALLLTQYIVPATVIMIMNKISGIVILSIGLVLLFKRTKNILKPQSDLGHDHSHAHEHTHDGHTHTHEIDDTLSFKSLMALGVSGGIVPCADALVILVVALSLQKLVFGLLLLIFFSLGLATALCVTGIMVVIAKNKAQERYTHLVRYQKYVSLFSAIIVILFGISLLFFTK